MISHKSRTAVQWASWPFCNDDTLLGYLRSHMPMALRDSSGGLGLLKTVRSRWCRRESPAQLEANAARPWAASAVFVATGEVSAGRW